MCDPTSDNASNGLIQGFLRSVARFPGRPALEIGGEVHTYSELHAAAQRIALALRRHDYSQAGVASVLAYRSLTAYSGILGILLLGKGYVPLNPKFPFERSLRMLNLSGADMLVVGPECMEHLKELLQHLDRSFVILMPDSDAADQLKQDFRMHTFIDAGLIDSSPSTCSSAPVSPDSPAYLLFTSGSTGIPKGIPVSHGNVRAYIDYTCSRYTFNEHDRFSQHFDLTFDLSVHDLFVCWEAGACLCCIPESDLMAPAKFIREKQLTAWFSVPSVAMFMAKLKQLKPHAFPSLRCSLFCGEALPAEAARNWQASAPNSLIENLYGPTETTIAITNYAWQSDFSPRECLNGLVPIGWVFEGHDVCVIDHEMNPVGQGEKGELCLSGKQVTGGYLNNPEKTKSQFITIEAHGDRTWYRTGDLVTRDERGCLYYHGRIDHQVKIHGFRVELQEVDAILREAAGTDLVVSIPWPVSGNMAEGIVSFISDDSDAGEELLIAHCRKTLPAYMVPQKCYFIHQMPINANGKIDRARLREMVENKEV